jgi:cyclopropane fatty-acyl-phospholipid synthase-like methyltransferase
MKEFWDERFGQKMYYYGKAPNVFYANQLIQLQKGKILLPAEGEGRNAVYAAIKGWTVKAFDFSEEGRKKALDLAASYDVTIDYQLMEASEFQASESFDVIALVFAHFAGEERKQLFEKLEKSLAPEGHLIMEVFSKNQLGRESGGPKDLELLYSKSEIQALFPNLDFLILEEMKIELDEGFYHQGDAAVIRVLAQKK